MSARTWEASNETHRVFCITAPNAAGVLLAAAIEAAKHEEAHDNGEAEWPSFTFNLMFNFESNDWYGELCVSTWDKNG